MKIKTTREKLNLARPQMAALMGMELSSLSRLETGARKETRQMRATLKILEALPVENLKKLLNEL